ncbi:serine-rich adhesin for platelets-like [Musca vetustissima]|uniref:serine-rich adhesin for platelets-like n=1 Tax=Musca vetustissima TaxID=27455 RepID=UPI002AB6738A|nr:serine-rich adhesin for platelets-like [Musca vetustissima]
MAASVAPLTTRTPKTSAETEASEIIRCKGNNHSETRSNSTQKTTYNSQELCRSCGKNSEDLYDLYQQQQQQQNTMASTNETKTDDDVMPFSTSSTTCYAGKTSTISQPNTTASCLASSASSTTVTAMSSSSGVSGTTTTTFDSVAATAKATAKGQSNMDNILQEMQIWHLQLWIPG